MTKAKETNKNPQVESSPAPVVIERARTEDFLAIAALDRRAWLANRNPEFIPDGEHVWRMWVEHAFVIVARSEGKILGVILAFPCMNGEYCLHKVFVDPACRGHGLGSNLFMALLRELDSLGVTSFLTVDPENKAAIALYEKYGFIHRTFVKGFYRESEDRYVLRRLQPAAQKPWK